MSSRTIHLPEALQDYMLKTTLRESEWPARLRRETAGMPNAQMQISPEQGQFMGLLVQLMGARRALEIGTFTGYSALCVAQALPPDGSLVACDISREWTDVGARYWEAAGVRARIDLRIGPALTTLDQLIADGQTGTFDFAFIDADKTGYDAYYERCLRLLRAGGLLAIDNAFRDGRVADPTVDDPDTRAVRELSRKVRDDARVTMCLVPIGDGLLLARKN